VNGIIRHPKGLFYKPLPILYHKSTKTATKMQDSRRQHGPETVTICIFGNPSSCFLNEAARFFDFRTGFLKKFRFFQK